MGTTDPSRAQEPTSRPRSEGARVPSTSAHQSRTTPRGLAAAAGLSTDQKRRILKEWERDALALEVAVWEGMPAAEPSRLDEIRDALREIGAS